MTFSITVQLWWFIPLLITIAAVIWVAWMTKDSSGSGGYYGGIGDGLSVMICMVPALFISMLAWIGGALLK